MAGTTIGVITYKVVEDHLEKIRKPVSVETGVFTTVSFATFDVLNRVKGSIEKKGEFVGMDQLQRNLILKTADGVMQIPTDRLLAITQDLSVEIIPGATIEQTPTGE